MHLTFVTNLYPPYVVGGNEMLCRDVVQALRARGHRVSVVCGRGRELPADADVHGVLEIDLDRKDETFLGGRLPSAWEAFKLHVFSPASYRTTTTALQALSPDVVVIWNLYMASLSPLVAATRAGVPLIVHLFDKWLYYGLSDLAALLQPKLLWKRAAVRGVEATLQPLLRLVVRPRELVAVSAFLKDFYARAGFPASAIDVELLGVPTAVFEEAPPRPRAPGEPLRLLFVGGLWEGKGPFTAVKAQAQLLRSGIRAHLDICGDGAPQFVSALKALVEAEGTTAHVTLHGRVSREEVRRLCQACDVFVFPSEWDEPFAAVPLEAMSCGRAVVATTAGGTPEAVSDGRTGLLVPPKQPDALAAALRRLAEDDRLRLALAANAAREVRERFDFDGYVDRLEARYARLLALRAASR
jgi:glycosyltransferase involved in cell wall biosynthesis